MPEAAAGLTRAPVKPLPLPPLSGRRRLARVLLAGGLLVAGVLLLLPSDELPQLDLWDKFEHAGTFAVLAVIGVRARLLRRLDRRISLAVTGLGLIGFGAVCEALQVFVPGREVTIDDAIANAVGVLAGMALAMALERWGGRWAAATG